MTGPFRTIEHHQYAKATLAAILPAGTLVVGQSAGSFGTRSVDDRLREIVPYFITLSLRKTRNQRGNCTPIIVTARSFPFLSLPFPYSFFITRPTSTNQEPPSSTAMMALLTEQLAIERSHSMPRIRVL
jgi:hypothetical protein